MERLHPMMKYGNFIEIYNNYILLMFRQSFNGSGNNIYNGKHGINKDFYSIQINTIYP